MQGEIRSKTELYSVKQLEYLAYYLRYKIYTNEREKAKMEDICNKIRKTVEQISFKEQSPSIFTSEHLKEKKLDEFLNEYGLPNIRYKNEYQKEMKGFWDRFYLLQRGTYVEYEGKVFKVHYFKIRFPKKDEKGNIESFFPEKVELISESGERCQAPIEEIKLNIRQYFEKL